MPQQELAQVEQRVLQILEPLGPVAEFFDVPRRNRNARSNSRKTNESAQVGPADNKGADATNV
jgi:hypothetical protein